MKPSSAEQLTGSPFPVRHRAGGRTRRLDRAFGRLRDAVGALILVFVSGIVPAHAQVSKQQSSAGHEALRQYSVRALAAEKEVEAERRQFLDRHNVTFDEGPDSPSAAALIRVEKGFPRFISTLTNLEAARTVDADRLWESGDAGFLVSGRDVIVGLWDANGVRVSHREFRISESGLISRIMQRDGSTTVNNHSTAVAGGIAALGVQGDAIGIAPEATVWAHNWFSDLPKMALAAAEGLRVSNHSYGDINGWGPSMTIDGVRLPAWYGDTRLSDKEDHRFGLYTLSSREWDEVARLAPGLLVVKAAGNDRGASNPPGAEHWVYDPHTFHWVRSTATRLPDGGEDGFRSVIGDGSVAKNVLSVAAAEVEPGFRSAPESILSKSNAAWGPTVDGRIKPDLVAMGVGGFSTAGWEDDAYMFYSGSSMAAAITTGAAALLLEREQSLGVGPWNAATRKALLLHTARESGPGPGPDYMFGWGMLNAHGAMVLLSEDALGGSGLLLRELVLEDGEEIVLSVDAEGARPLKATIVWADPEGQALDRRPNSSIRSLVNDLDLLVVGPDGEHEPWVLDPSRPALPATRGDNTVDNVEQVVVVLPGARTYEVRISHKRRLEGGSQPVSLVLSGVFNPGLSIDHDGDGIQTRWEDVDGEGSVFNDDTDGDGVANYLDSDDDGDKIPTAEELAGALVGGRPVNPPDWDENGLPDYLDARQLPIELVSFRGVAHGEEILLTWTTASETGNAGFEVQHAFVDGYRTPLFQTLGWVDGAGNSLEMRTYSYAVQGLGFGYHLFRLKQIDLDGAFSLSPAIDVVLEWDAATSPLRVYPNPANDLVMVEFGMAREKPVRVALFDVLGRERAFVFEGTSGVDQLKRTPLFVRDLPAGLYFVRVEVGSAFAMGRSLVVGSDR